MYPPFFLFLSLAAFGQRPQITGDAHIALYVADIEKSRAFYKDFLGYEEPFSLRNPDGTLSMAFIKINDRQYVELSPEREKGSDRLNHISFEVADAEATRRYLASKGIKVSEKTPKGRIGNSNFTIKDPDGHGVEFVQYEPDGRSMREKGKFLGQNRISTRMMHFGILVGELTPAMAFYRQLLGFEEFWRGSRDGQVLNWINMRTPNGQDYVEFMLYDRLPDPDKRGTAHHICLEVADIEKSVADLEKRPYRKTYGRMLEIRTGVNRKRQCNLYDPDGTRIELMEPRTVDGVPTPSATAAPPKP